MNGKTLGWLLMGLSVVLWVGVLLIVSWQSVVLATALLTGEWGAMIRPALVVALFGVLVWNERAKRKDRVWEASMREGLTDWDAEREWVLRVQGKEGTFDLHVTGTEDKMISVVKWVEDQGGRLLSVRSSEPTLGTESEQIMADYFGFEALTRKE